MTDADILGLAKQADAVSIDVNGDRKKASERLEHFAKLVIEAHNKELLEGSGEPVAWVRPSSKENGIVYDSTFRDAVGCVAGKARIEQGFQPLHTPDQLAAAVLREREKHSELLEALLDCLECEFPVSEKAVIEKARTAIAKYKGESK